MFFVVDDDDVAFVDVNVIFYYVDVDDYDDDFFDKEQNAIRLKFKLLCFF